MFNASLLQEVAAVQVIFNSLVILGLVLILVVHVRRVRQNHRQFGDGLKRLEEKADRVIAINGRFADWINERIQKIKDCEESSYPKTNSHQKGYKKE